MPATLHNRLVTMHHDLYLEIEPLRARLDAAELELAQAREERRRFIGRAVRVGVGVSELARELTMTPTAIQKILAQPGFWDRMELDTF